MATLSVQPLQNQPTLNPKVLSAPQNQPTLAPKVVQAKPQLNLSVVKAVPQGQITSIGTSDNQQPYTPKKSLVEFGQLIKSKYPEYSEIEDEELAKMTISKHPEYESQVDVPTVEEPKKDGLLKSLAKNSVDYFGRLGKTAEYYSTSKALGGTGAGKSSAQITAGNFKPAASLKDAGSLALEAASFAVGGGGAGGVAKTGLTGAIKQATKQGIKLGALSGALSGAGTGLQKENSNAGSIALDTLKGAGTGALIGGALGGVGSTLSRVAKGKAPSLLTEEAISITKPQNFTKKESIGLLKSGKAEQTGLLRSIKPKITAHDREIAESVSHVVKKNNGVVANINAVNDEISRVSQKEIRPFLEKNNKPFNQQTFRARLNKIEPPRMVKGDATLNNTYNQVKELMLEKVAQHPKNNTGLWDARIAFDKEIEREFPALYGSEKYTAIKQAVADVRRVANDFIGMSTPNLTFKEQLKRLSNIYVARENIAENSYRLLESNVISRFAKQHPNLTKTVKYGLGIGLPLAGASRIFGDSQ